VLVGATLLALILANSALSDVYQRVLHAHAGIDLGFYQVEGSVHFWINDGAMALFFLLVGIEVKRELAIGELNSLRRALVPCFAAAGGMAVPAVIFLALAPSELASGWGVPIATDIAFAVGVAGLVGPRLPSGLKVLLLALAIFDDIGAVLVIAFFYAGTIAVVPLAGAFLSVGAVWLLLRSGQRSLPPYILLGVAAWACALASGVHPTLVGVALGMLTPWRAWEHPERVMTQASQLLATRMGQGGTAADMRQLRQLASAGVSPLDGLEDSLHHWVAFGIVPVFALANAGLDFRGGGLGEALASPVAWGVAAGLVLGKPVGIVAASWLAVRAGAQLPEGVRWSGVLGIGMLGGVGFTVALFVAELAYSDAGPLAASKFGIFAASLASAAGGYTMLRLMTRRPAA
jgi:NhaA family Na+:H+ antiporter